MKNGILYLRYVAAMALIFSIDTGCPPPALFVTVTMPNGIFSGPVFSMKASELGNIHVALEGMPVARIEGLLDDQVGRPAAARSDVRVGGVEVHVRWHILPRLDQRRARGYFPPRALDAPARST